VRNGHAGILGLIISFGGDPNVTDREGNNSLHVAAVGGEMECMQALVLAEKGVDVKGEGEGEGEIVVEVKGGNSSPWVPCATENGQVYYYNHDTGESSWENPFVQQPVKRAPTPPLQPQPQSVPHNNKTCSRSDISSDTTSEDDGENDNENGNNNDNNNDNDNEDAEFADAATHDQNENENEGEMAPKVSERRASTRNCLKLTLGRSTSKFGTSSS